MTGIKGKSGGAREGSGRKAKAGEPTVPRRIPISILDKVDKMIEQVKKRNEKKKP
jgi:hypothetical protein